MSRSVGTTSYEAKLSLDYFDFIPVYEFPPVLSAEEVERFVALGELGWERSKNGDNGGAEAAFRGQVAIYRMNPEPFVALALLKAQQGVNDEALELMRSAVVRGFSDMRRIDRTELWIRLRKNFEYKRLKESVPALVELEQKQTAWDTFVAPRPPASLEEVRRGRARAVARIDAMAPALGPRGVRLWNRIVEGVTVSLLETYVRNEPDAPDHPEAIGQLMTMYLEGPMLSWKRLTKDVAKGLGEVSRMTLKRFPDSPMRSTALVGEALARNAERNRKGVLLESAAARIRECLVEVLSRYPNTPLASTAAVGLIRTEQSLGHTARAAEIFADYRDAHTGDPAAMWNVRGQLGELALRLGGMPDFRATTLAGDTVDAEAIRGKVAVVEFWATWCKPCVDGFPTLRRISERHGDEVVVLGVNLDDADDLDRDGLREWVEREQLPGSHVHDGMSWESDLVKTFGVREIPFNVVVGPDGSVLAVNQHGKRLEKAVRAAVR